MVTIRSIITLISLLSTTQVYAFSIALEKSTHEGVLQKAVTIDNKKAVMSKNSNYFDEDSQSIGLFSISNKDQLTKTISEINRIEKALDLIATKAKNPSSLKKPEHEKTYIKLGGHFISPKHPLFEKLDKNLSSLFKEVKVEKVDVLEIKKEDGYLVKVINNKGKTSKSNFDYKANCQQRGDSLVCDDKKYGILYIK